MKRNLICIKKEEEISAEEKKEVEKTRSVVLENIKIKIEITTKKEIVKEKETEKLKTTTIVEIRIETITGKEIDQEKEIALEITIILIDTIVAKRKLEEMTNIEEADHAQTEDKTRREKEMKVGVKRLLGKHLKKEEP